MIDEALILCGGLATRLGPLTSKTPKSLIPVNGEPFLAHQLRLLRRNSIEKAVLCIGHLGERIREFAGDGSSFGMKVSYSEDGPVALGTGGAIRQALGQAGERFFVVYGDSYLPCDYQKVAETFESSGKPGLMTVYRNEGAYDTSNVEFADGRILKYDKRNRTEAMTYIDYGLGAFSREVFLRRQEAVLDLADVYSGLLADGQLAAAVIGERFYEIGSVAGIAETEAFIRARS